MNQPCNREQLLASFVRLQHQFDDSLQFARGLEAEFDQGRQHFIEHISQALQGARQRLSDRHPLQQQLLSFIDVMEATRTEWNRKVAGREKGVRFRAGFEDSLLVFVNGKVKSGKSSLGNYMAWGNTDPHDALKAGLSAEGAPRFFSQARTQMAGGDADNEAVLRREFRVGAIEATSSIQGFSLPGLTWVDSPGMHSQSADNERLAREYVEHADLILYTMKSDAPGRESDLAEIRLLLRKGKRLLLLLTGSDDLEEEMDGDGESLVQVVVMKDQARRAQQRDYVFSALRQSFTEEELLDVSIVSISARYAQLHAGDEAAFRDSGMGELCDTLFAICQSDGVSIKRQTPLVNLANFLLNCRTDLQPYQALLDGFNEPLRTLKAKSDRQLKSYIQQGQHELGAFINDFFDQGDVLRAKADGVGRELADFQQALNRRCREIAAEKLARQFEHVMTGFKAAVQQTYSDSALVRLPGFELETVTEQIPTVQKGTRGRNSAIGSVLGGIAGFLIGGPAGAGIGIGLGGAAGGAIGRDAGMDYYSIDVTVGDNWLDIRRKAMEGSRVALEQSLLDGSAHLWRLMNQEVEQILSGLSREITAFDRRLQTLQKKTSQY